MTHGSLFSGIGGFDLAAEWMGWENVFHCEINKFCKKILKYYWPESIQYENICETDFSIHNGKIDIISGGFPCQPYSHAGKRLGKNDERHLWPQMLRAIKEINPVYILGENVRGLTNWNGGVVFEEICNDLENIGYEIAPCIIPACSVGAPHKRERIWIVAHSTSIRHSRNSEKNGTNDTEKRDLLQSVADNGYEIRSETKRCSKVSAKPTNWENFPTQSPICSGNDGFPGELDDITFPKWRQQSIMGYGNAIVPNVAYEIFKIIQKMDDNAKNII